MYMTTLPHELVYTVSTTAQTLTTAQMLPGCLLAVLPRFQNAIIPLF